MTITKTNFDIEDKVLKIWPIPGDMYARFCPPQIREMRAEGICAPLPREAFVSWLHSSLQFFFFFFGRTMWFVGS